LYPSFSILVLGSLERCVLPSACLCVTLGVVIET
jgi:hypothetical protein